MEGLEKLVMTVKQGASRVEGETNIDGQKYLVRVYRMGDTLIRVDLERKIKQE